MPFAFSVVPGEAALPLRWCLIPSVRPIGGTTNPRCISAAGFRRRVVAGGPALAARATSARRPAANRADRARGCRCPWAVVARRTDRSTSAAGPGDAGIAAPPPPPADTATAPRWPDRAAGGLSQSAAVATSCITSSTAASRPLAQAPPCAASARARPAPPANRLDWLAASLRAGSGHRGPWLKG